MAFAGWLPVVVQVAASTAPAKVLVSFGDTGVGNVLAMGSATFLGHGRYSCRCGRVRAVPL